MMPDYTNLLKEIEKLDRDSLLHLSGFLEGLLAHSVPSAETLADQVSTQVTGGERRKILIAFASQSGNAENVALQLFEELEASNHQLTLNDVAELNIKKLPQYHTIIIVASTHGEGEPPDTAIQFYEQFKSDRTPRLEGVEYGVIALGDSSYEQFCSFGIWIDQRLSELGAQSFIERLDCDVDYEDAIDQWQEKMLATLSSAKYGIQPTPSLQSPSITTDRSNALEYTIKNPLQVEVITNTDLCTDKVNKHVHHLELELPSDKISYTPGDSLGISIDNPSQLVAGILSILGLNGDEKVDFKHKSTTLEECLRHDAELFRLTQKQLNEFVDKHPNQALQKVLNDAGTNADFIATHDWLSVLKYYRKDPQQSLTAQKFVDFLNPQGQRLYSIASSPIAHEEEVHLTIRLREFGQDKRLGLISDRVHHLRAGDKANVYLKPNKNFRLPENHSTPIIMIGSGTGIAPFRAFLYQRLELNITSPAWLFFGEQSFRNSFLYQTDWLKFKEKKILTQLSVAFSRDSDKKYYVQHRLEENAKEVYTWIEQGAVIYVCGSADGMATAVHNTLIDILSQHAGVNHESAKQKLQHLIGEGFYKRDVY